MTDTSQATRREIAEAVLLAALESLPSGARCRTIRDLWEELPGIPVER